MLQELCTDEVLLSGILEGPFCPFPTIDNRAFWDGIDQEVTQRYTQKAEEYIGKRWEAMPGSLYRQVYSIGNRSNYEALYWERRSALSELALAECMTNTGRYLEPLFDLIWAICEESSWCLPASTNEYNQCGLPDKRHPNVSLYSGETASALTAILQMLQPRLDAISPLICKRIRDEVEERILTPYLTIDTFWWMGFTGERANNWNPWTNKNVLYCFLALENDVQRKKAAVQKCARSLDIYFDWYSDDGGCDEGPGYWNGSVSYMLDILELLYSVSKGRISLFENEKVRKMAAYIYKAHIDGRFFLDFADAPAKSRVISSVIAHYGMRIGDPVMLRFGRAAYWDYGNWILDANPGFNLPRAVNALVWHYTEGVGERTCYPYQRDVWLPLTQVFSARMHQGSVKGLFLGGKGGHNNECHNHNDVGQFVVYADGNPVIVDAGVGVYSMKTFNEHRYEIWTMQSQYHNLPVVNGCGQPYGEQYRASDLHCIIEDAYSSLSLDLAKAYPPEAGIRRWERTMTLDRLKGAAIIREDFALDSLSDRVELHLLTCRACELGDGEILLAGCEQGQSVRLAFDGALWNPSVEEIPIEDEKLHGFWGDRLFRLILTSRRPVTAEATELRFAQVEE